MTVACRPQIQACAMRIARLDSNGVPHPGADSLAVVDTLVQLTANPEIAAGTEFEVRTACDAVCLAYQDCDKIKRLNVTLNLCKVDPEVYELLAGGTMLTGTGGRTGYAYPRLNDAACPDGASLELWAKRIDETGGIDPDFAYNWWVFPRVYLQISDRTFENGPFENTFSGRAIENANWFDGAANDWDWASTSVAQFMPTNSLPAAGCGSASLIAS